MLVCNSYGIETRPDRDGEGIFCCGLKSSDGRPAFMTFDHRTGKLEAGRISGLDAENALRARFSYEMGSGSQVFRGIECWQDDVAG